MSTNETRPLLRLTLLAAIAMVAFGALVSRLWFLQVLAGATYASAAEENRVGLLELEAPRGRILAADGTELVKNRPAQTISAHRGQLLNAAGEPRDEVAEAVLDRLEVLLDLDRETILDRLASRRTSVFRPVPIAEDVRPEVVFAIREHSELFPGVVAETLPVRTYPSGTLAAHVLGYIGEISSAELETEQYADYRAGDLIGWAGLERTWEPWLRGTDGLRKLEVNVTNTVQRELSERPPVRGHDLVTSIDFELQRDLERLLEDGILASRFTERKDGTTLPSVAGSAVVLDPRDGNVVAMASWPTFDPAEFVGGVSHDYWSVLQDPDNHFPLLNRTIQSAYPPGSTFKIVSGAMGLRAGIITTSTRLSCPPAWSLGGITFRNWNPRHEGSLDLSAALMRSCDTFFYEVAYQQWLREERQEANEEPVVELLPAVAAEFGLGQTLGIDLPGEKAGVIPGRAWRTTFWEQHRDTYCRKAAELEPGYAKEVNQDLCLYGGAWRGGDSVNSSIGQGDVLTTPLQIAAAYSAIANGGTLWQPQVVDHLLAPDVTIATRAEPVALQQLSLDEAQMAAIRAGLELGRLAAVRVAMLFPEARPPRPP
ncbi:MAG: penicillin-binding protein 2, partial [Nitriliruptorales bacterium]|nr:penicillin-binding protein 2 [Nitriliruptorales bacterium]